MNHPMCVASYKSVGIYIDLTQGGGIAGCRICLLQETPTGRLVMQSIDGNSMAVVLGHISTTHLAELMSTVHACLQVA